MTKTEFHKAVNKVFINYIETNFPQYDLDFEDGGRVYLIPNNGHYKNITDNSIEYHLSRHEVCTSKNASSFVKDDVKNMEIYLEKSIIPIVKLLGDIK